MSAITDPEILKHLAIVRRELALQRAIVAGLATRKIAVRRAPTKQRWRDEKSSQGARHG